MSNSVAADTAPSSVRAQQVDSRRVLVVDDEADLCELLVDGLQAEYAVDSCRSPKEALRRLEGAEYAVLIVDIHMEGESGIDLCRTAVARQPNLLPIVMTGFGTIEHAVEAMRAGAFDFVTKPFGMESMKMVVERAMRHRAMSDELQRLRRRVGSRQRASLLSTSESMQHVNDMVARIADSDTSVLITGESGAGKEVVARAIHDQSGRKGPFLAINCAAVPETLLESVLFGHLRGAFTDASVSKNGLFVEANDGTLFLDEVGEMPLAMQAKLLRALQERKVRPLGGGQEVPFNARLITATNRSLEEDVTARRFREDLFYRINVVRIDVPPLRRRGNDVLELAHLFMQRAAAKTGHVNSMDRSVAERLLAYDWPGNVRELENCIERAVALARYDRLTLDDLPAKVRDYEFPDVALADTVESLLPWNDVEERYILRVLKVVGNNKTQTASLIGYDRRTLYRKLKAMARKGIYDGMGAPHSNDAALVSGKGA